MVYRDFVLDKRKFRRRKSTTIQHKLRVLMKCYTVVDFDLNDEAQEYTFKKTHKINGLKMDDPKEYRGRFEVEDLDDGKVNLRLIVGETRDAD
jgi:hypothetical protein